MSRAADEPVRLTRIYTRGGDAGETSLGDGSRVSKLDARIAAFGTTDELNSLLGVVLAGELPDGAAERRCSGSRTSCSTSAPTSACRSRSRAGCASSRGWSTSSRALCDAFNESLPELKSFVLPGRDRRGGRAARRAHRLPAGRARDARGAAAEHDVNPLVAVYLNRLSDLLFILARAANALAGADEPLWKPGASR